MVKLKPLYTSHPAVIVVFGLLIAQIIATIQVYLSNLGLYNTLTVVNSAGYLAIPNKLVMQGLRDLKPTFWGGLFFTFTVGAGITLGSMAAAWIWVRVFWRQKPAFIVLQIFWLGLLILVNIRGFTLMPTLYFLLVPPVIFALTARCENAGINWDRKSLLIHLIPLPLLALLWFTQFDNEMFLDLRDNLLLSNFYGKKFSDFYYAYTLYPAEAFKALDQKIIKTSGLRDINSRSLKMKLERKLIDNGYLPLNDNPTDDMVVRQMDDHFVFEAHGRRILDASLNQFLSEPRNILRSFSEKTDRQAVFRQLTFLSILVGFPVLIYILLHAVFYFPAYYAIGRKPATLAASIICLLLGIMVFAYFQANRSSNIRIQNIAEALRSDRWQIRVAALKMIQKKELDIAVYPEYQHLINSGIPQQRYWLAKTLAYSRQPETIDDLLKFLHDKNLNVRTMALYSLGLRKDPRAIRPVLKKIEDSESWYCQMYAYNALRTLGWKQTKFH